MIWPIATPLELPVSPPVHESRICHSAPEKRGPTLEIGHAPPQEKRIHREVRDTFVRYAEQRPGGRIVSLIGRSLLITTIASKELVSSLRNAFPLPRQSLAAFLWSLTTLDWIFAAKVVRSKFV